MRTSGSSTCRVRNLRDLARGGVAAIAGALMLACGAPLCLAGDGQWTSSGPYGGFVEALAISPVSGRCWLGLGTIGLFSSDDAGLSWSRADGVPAQRLTAIFLGASDEIIVIGGSIGVYASTDRGATWTIMGDVKPHPMTTAVYSGVDGESTRFYLAGGDSGMFRIQDGETTWSPVTVRDSTMTNVRALQAVGANLLAGTESGIFVSDDLGVTWAHGSGTQPGSVEDLELLAGSPPGTVFAASDGDGVWRSSDAGVSWVPASNGLTDSRVVDLAVLLQQGKVVAATATAGAFTSADLGALWVEDNSGLTRRGGRRIAAYEGDTETTVLFGTAGSGVFAQHAGADWRSSSTGLAGLTVPAIATMPAGNMEVMVGTRESGPFTSDDGGDTWIMGGEDVIAREVDAIYLMPDAPGTMFLGTPGKLLNRAGDNLTYSEIDLTPHIGSSPIRQILADTNDPGHLFLAAECGGILESVDEGGGWSATSTIAEGSCVGQMAVDATDADLLLAWVTGLGVYRSYDGGGTWALAYPPQRLGAGRGGTITAFAPHPLVTGTIYVGTDAGLLVTRDFGSTFSVLNAVLATAAVSAVYVARSPQPIVFAVGPDRLYAFSDDGNLLRFIDLPAVGTLWRALTADEHTPRTFHLGGERSEVFSITAAGVAPDLQAPTITHGPYATFQGPRILGVEWWTDEPASTIIDNGDGLGSYQNVYSRAALVRRHAAALPGVSELTPTHLRLQMQDGSGNTATRLVTVPATVPATDSISITAGPVVSATTPASALIAWRTSHWGSSTVTYYLDSNDPWEITAPGLGTEHAVKLVGLEANRTYSYRVKSASSGDRTQVASDEKTFTTAPNADTTPPVLLAGPEVRWIDDDLVVIAWTTDEASDSAVTYAPSAAQDETQTVQDSVLTRDHLVSIGGLAPSTEYTFAVRSTDASGNALVEGTVGEGREARGGIHLWTTYGAPDAAAPVLETPTVVPGTSTALLNWSSNESGDSRVDYGTTAELGQVAYRTEAVTEHEIALSGLVAGTPYFFAVSSADPAGNVASSEVLSFATETVPDEVGPSIATGPAASDISSSGAAISWETGEPATSIVRYWKDEDGEQEAGLADYITDHVVTLSSLEGSTTYRYYVVSADLSGNPTTSSEGVFTTMPAPVPGAAGISIGILLVAITFLGYRLRSAPRYGTR
ncbi:MAG: hypothetical protein HYV63_28970 [Candidatus Schekmanbacteria bacterium]|nr:hypothetical protein [Candidatus Schekmanbacteria bacterium]